MYSVSYGRILETISGHADAIAALCINGTNLVSGSWDASVKLWNVLPSGISKNPVLDFTDHDTEVRCVAINSTGTMAASGSEDGVAMLWDLRKKKCAGEIRAHSETISSVCFLPDNSGRIITSSTDQFIKIFESNGTETCYWNAKEPVISHAAIDSNRLLTGDSKGSLRLWNLKDSTEIAHFAGHKAAISSICVSDECVISGGVDGEIIHWVYEN